MQYIKNISELCSVCLSRAAFTCYTTSKTWRLEDGHLLQTYFDQLPFVTVQLVCVINNVCAAEPERCPAFTDYFTDCIARPYFSPRSTNSLPCLVPFKDIIFKAICTIVGQSAHSSSAPLEERR